MTGQYLESVILGEANGCGAWTIRLLLFPLSLIYRIGLALFLLPYQIGLRKKYKLKVPIISVGNLTFGGTGKTPVVQTICRTLQARGLKVVVLSRGHGGSARGSLVVSDGQSILSDSGQAGDEPLLLAESLPGVPIVVGKDRRKSGELAVGEFNPDVIVLDDGLQYWQLHRDVEIIVMNAARPFGSGYVMPMGDLREPATGIRRADIVILSNAKAVDAAECRKLAQNSKRRAKNALVFTGNHRPVCLKKPGSDATIDLDFLDDRSVFAFCGIGRPAAFVNMLLSLGARVDGTLVFPDHHAYHSQDIQLIQKEFARSGAEFIVTTAKDLARLSAHSELLQECGSSALGIFILEIVFKIEDSSDFASYICDKIN